MATIKLCSATMVTHELEIGIDRLLEEPPAVDQVVQQGKLFL